MNHDSSRIGPPLGKKPSLILTFIYEIHPFPSQSLSLCKLHMSYLCAFYPIQLTLQGGQSAWWYFLLTLNIKGGYRLTLQVVKELSSLNYDKLVNSPDWGLKM